MRISDWSSDVCSSDLGVAAITLGAMVVLEFLSGMPVLGLANALFAKVLAFKYVLEIVRDSADGHRDPPEFGSDLDSSLAIALILVQVLALALIVLSGMYLGRSEEHTSELQSLMRISYAVFC